MSLESLQSIHREIPSEVKLGVTQGDIVGTSETIFLQSIPSISSEIP